jgi:hypothetical protein
MANSAATATGSSSQDCAICLNSIAVSSISKLFSEYLLIANPALPIAVRRTLLAYLALQVCQVPAAVAKLPRLHLSQLSGRRRSRS